jgi:excisionase family DNA binding protein
VTPASTTELATLSPVLKIARVTGISKSKLYRMIQDGRLKGRLVGRHIRIHRDDLEKMLEELPRVGD